jgi:hypothetical protein
MRGGGLGKRVKSFNVLDSQYCLTLVFDTKILISWQMRLKPWACGKGFLWTLKIHPGQPCFTPLNPVGGPLLKQPYGRFKVGPSTGWAASTSLDAPLGTPMPFPTSRPLTSPPATSPLSSSCLTSQTRTREKICLVVDSMIRGIMLKINIHD